MGSAHSNSRPKSFPLNSSNARFSGSAESTPAFPFPSASGRDSFSQVQLPLPAALLIPGAAKENSNHDHESNEFSDSVSTSTSRSNFQSAVTMQTHTAPAANPNEPQSLDHHSSLHHRHRHRSAAAAAAVPLTVNVSPSSYHLPARARVSPSGDIRVTFSQRDRGSSALFRQFKPIGSSLKGSLNSLNQNQTDTLTSTSISTSANANGRAALEGNSSEAENPAVTTSIPPTEDQQNQTKQFNLSEFDSNGGDKLSTHGGSADHRVAAIMDSSDSAYSLSPDLALADRVYYAASTGRHPFSTLDLSMLAPEEIHPRYTRLVRIFLMSVGLVPFRSKFLKQNPSFAYVFPVFIFIFLLANVCFITYDANSNDIRRSAGLKIVSSLFSHAAPFASWVGCYYYIGVSKLRAEYLFTQLANLESFDSTVSRNTTIAALLAGLVLIGTTNLGSLPTSLGTGSPFALTNLFLFIALNYLIITFVIILLCSLICRFHVVSLRLFCSAITMDSMTVVEALREHGVLMRLIHQTAIYVQWVLGLPLLLYLSSAVISAFQMLSTGIYAELNETAFTLVLAIVMLMIPLFFASQVTTECRKLKEIARNCDLCDSLLERQSFLQQLVLYSSNGFFLFGVEIRNSLLFRMAYSVVAVLVALVRGSTT